MPTKSYARFTKNISTVERLNDTYHSIRQARGKKGRAAFDHVTRSAIIFLASAFEVYVEDVIKECCEQHINFARDAIKLPRDVKSTLNKYVKVESNGTPPVDLCDEGWRIVYRKIATEKTEKLNTPKKDQISVLFNDLVGISEREVNDIQDIDKLNGVIKFRGDIAHRIYASSYVNIEQVIDNTNIINNVAKGLDKMILKKFRNTYPQNRLPWNEVY